jgi:hypothetical protein
MARGVRRARGSARRRRRAPDVDGQPAARPTSCCRVYSGRDSARPTPPRSSASRALALQKDALWFQRYQATDGYNVYGGRSSLRYTAELVSNGRRGTGLRARALELRGAAARARATRRACARTWTRRSMRLRAAIPRASTARPAAVDPGADQPARAARVPRRRGGDRAHAARARSRSAPVRQRAAVPRAREPRADVVRYARAAVGRGLAELSAPAAVEPAARRAPRPRGRRRRRSRGSRRGLRRSARQPDGLRVLERRRPRRVLPRSPVPEGHRRRRSLRRARARAARPVVGRHAPLGEQLRVRSRGRALLPGGRVPPLAGRVDLRRAPRPRRGRVALRSAQLPGRALRRLRLRESARPRVRPLGHRLVTDGTGNENYDALRSRRAHAARPAPGRAPRSSRSARGRRRDRDPLERALPARVPGQLPDRERHRLPGRLPLRAGEDGSTFHGREETPLLFSSDPNFRPSTSRSVPTARCGCSTGRRR